MRHVDGHSGEFGTLLGANDPNRNKPLDQRGNGIVGQRKRLLIDDYVSPEAALRNGPVDDVIVRVAHQADGVRSIRRGESDVFWVNADFPYGAGEEGLIAVKVTPLHKNERVVLASRVFFLEVTCSDGVFCNGAEHFIDGKCTRAKSAACDDHDSCTRGECCLYDVANFVFCLHYSLMVFCCLIDKNGICRHLRRRHRRVSLGDAL